mmetsp:Transcript_12013/g.19099  ORF Transcript_12013/g.19099 Transcript_12013/m.19099 type:complete len:184 (-) Transcript_12013:176-727(-)
MSRQLTVSILRKRLRDDQVVASGMIAGHWLPPNKRLKDSMTDVEDSRISNHKKTRVLEEKTIKLSAEIEFFASNTDENWRSPDTSDTEIPEPKTPAAAGPSANSPRRTSSTPMLDGQVENLSLNFNRCLSFSKALPTSSNVIRPKALRVVISEPRLKLKHVRLQDRKSPCSRPVHPNSIYSLK